MTWVKKDCKPDGQQKGIVHKILKALIYWYEKKSNPIKNWAKAM